MGRRQPGFPRRAVFAITVWRCSQCNIHKYVSAAALYRAEITTRTTLGLNDTLNKLLIWYKRGSIKMVGTHLRVLKIRDVSKDT